MKRLARSVGLLLALFLHASAATAHAECAWVLIEPATVNPESSWWERFWYRRQHGSGWVVNQFFRSADECRTVESKWTAEASKIMVSQTKDLHQTLRAAHMLASRCIPVEALSLFSVRPGSTFPSR